MRSEHHEGMKSITNDQNIEFYLVKHPRNSLKLQTEA